MLLTAISVYLAVISAVWLVGAGIIAVEKPRRAIKLLSKMGGTPAVHFGEHIVRLLVGASFMIGSAVFAYPRLFFAFGSFLAISSILIMILPRAWHHAYAKYWAGRISETIMRFIGASSIVLGITLGWVIGIS